MTSTSAVNVASNKRGQLAKEICVNDEPIDENDKLRVNNRYGATTIAAYVHVDEQPAEQRQLNARRS